MTTSVGTTGADIVKAAGDLVPVLRKNSLQVDQDRRLLDENIAALTDIGVFRMARPKRFGGYETPLPETCKVLAEIARGCASTAWVASASVVSTFMAIHLPDSAQEELFATDDTRLSGSFAPTAELTPTAGGYQLTGRWPYQSGCLHSHWGVVSARLLENGGESLKLCLVPMSDLSIEDDWYTYGLRGTGSCTTVGQEVFVPADRVLDMQSFLSGNWEARPSNVDSPWFQLPVWPAFLILGGASVPCGIARAAVEVFEERIAGRPITYTDYQDQSQTVPAQLDLATAAIRVEAAESLSNELAESVWAMGGNADDPSMLDRQRLRAMSGFIVEICREAVETVTRSSGASSIRSDCVTQLIFRDSEALAMHAALNLTGLYESYGRVRLGLPPVSNLA